MSVARTLDDIRVDSYTLARMVTTPLMLSLGLILLALPGLPGASAV